ncbi:MAG: amidohydrolase family protein [Anaerolineae bacterium]
MILDVHSHLGYDVVFDEIITEQELVGAYDANGVDAGIVQPLIVEPLEAPQRRMHDQVYALTQKYPGRFFGMASINPHCGEAFYREEMRRCMRELGFVGIKLTPIAHAVNPLTPDGRLAFEVSRELKVPIMVHTGAGIPFALPALLLPLAKEYRDLPIVVAHSGLNILAGEAIILGKECENVYLDTSWTAPHTCKAFLRALGPQKLMFASDMWDNQVVELCKWRTLGISAADLEWVLGKTGAQVYRVPMRP